MIKKKLVLADKDELYLVNLSNYFMENAPQLELNIFTREDKLHQYLADVADADIVLVDEAFAGPELGMQARDAVKLVLSASMTPVEGFDIVRKYQKTSALLSDVLLKYAENTGSLEAIKGQSSTRTVVFYSPAGGSGKTTLALALASVCVRMGMRTFYLNLEEIDSVQDILKPAPGSLSDVILALKTAGANAGIKLASCSCADENNGFYYVSGMESVSENEEVNGDEIVRLLQTINSLSEYDVLIVDTTSGLSERTRRILENADVIFVPIVQEENSIAKMQRLLREAELHEDYDPIFRKMNLVVNKSGMPGPGKALVESGLLDQLPCCGFILSEPDFLRRMNVLRAGENLCPVMEPLARILMNPEGNEKGD